jgi:hypothetical protein
MQKKLLEVINVNFERTIYCRAYLFIMTNNGRNYRVWSDTVYSICGFMSGPFSKLNIHSVEH